MLAALAAFTVFMAVLIVVSAFLARTRHYIALITFMWSVVTVAAFGYAIGVF